MPIYLTKPIWLVPLVMLVAAVGPWPYGYFMLLRLVVCGAAAFLAYSLLQRKTFRGLGWAFAVLALLYNPILPVHFERELWMVLNVLSAVPFVIFGWKSSQLCR